MSEQTPTNLPASPARPDRAVVPQVPDHEMIRRIGGGSYGEVWLARSVMGTYRAVKIVYRDSFDNERPFLREFNGIQKFEPISRSHESQVDILQVGKGEGYFYYVMELADDASAECRAQNAECGEPTLTRPAATLSHPMGEGRGGSQSQASTLNPQQALDRASYVPRTLGHELYQRGKLPFEECLRISLSLTTALEHLHKHGLVHRDIKPSNIIFVNGIPKLADIGLVTSIDATVSYVGTEGFLPPEGPGTPQGDIYSLGKVLYEICTGRDRQDFPELPTNLAELPEREGLLELNAIISKACKNAASDRYQSATEMHADIVLLQSGKSVRRVRSLERRLARATRVGIIAGLVAVVAVGAYLIAQNQVRRARETSAMEATLRQQAETARAEEAKLRQQAEAERQKAQTEAAKSKEVAQFLKDMLEGVGPSVALGRDTKMLREILDKTAARVGKGLTNQPEVEMELRATLAGTYEDLGLYKQMEEMARQSLEVGRAHLGEEHPAVAVAMTKLGMALHNLGSLEEAECFLRQALASQRKLPGAESHEMADSLSDLGLVLWTVGKLAEAEALSREALEMFKRVVGYESENVASCLNNLALILRDQGKLAEAEAICREALAIDRRIAGSDGLVAALHLNNLGNFLLAQDKLVEAEACYREALAINRKLLPSENLDIAWSMDNLSTLLLRKGELSEAGTLCREGLAMRRRLFGDEHLDVAQSLYHLAAVLSAEGKLVEAEAVAREALAIRRKLLGDVHLLVADSFNSLAGISLDQRKLAEAESSCREALAIRRKLFGNEDVRVAEALSGLAAYLHRQSKEAEAEAAVRECLAIREKQLPDDWRTFNTRCRLGTILLGQKKYAEAEPLLLSAYQGMKQREDKISPGEKARLRDALERLARLYKDMDCPDQAKAWRQDLIQTEMVEIQSLRARLSADDPQLADALVPLFSNLFEETMFAEAEPLVRECLAIREMKMPDDPLAFYTSSLLGGCLLGQKKYAEAEPLLVSGYDGMKQREDKIPAAGKSRLKEALQRLVQLYEATDRPDQAAQWKQKLNEFEKTEAEKKAATAQP